MHKRLQWFNKHRRCNPTMHLLCIFFPITDWTAQQKRLCLLFVTKQNKLCWCTYYDQLLCIFCFACFFEIYCFFDHRRWSCQKGTLRLHRFHKAHPCPLVASFLLLCLCNLWLQWQQHHVLCIFFTTFGCTAQHSTAQHNLWWSCQRSLCTLCKNLVDHNLLCT